MTVPRSPSNAVPAATLVLFRDRTAQPPELLMVERSASMAFAAGAMVFPGGRVDADDRAIAGRFPDLEPDDAAARIAAIRETIEESGLGVALSPGPDAATLAVFRAVLARGEAPFSALIDRQGLRLDLGLLTPFARWRPNRPERRVFDTRFYVAAAPGAPEPIVDRTENARALWTSATEVLAAADAGKARVIFPTRRNLERLALFADHAEAVAHSLAHPVETITPWVEDRDGVPHLCIAEGRGYPMTSLPMSQVERD